MGKLNIKISGQRAKITMGNIFYVVLIEEYLDGYLIDSSVEGVYLRKSQLQKFLVDNEYETYTSDNDYHKNSKIDGGRFVARIKPLYITDNNEIDIPFVKN